MILLTGVDETWREPLTLNGVALRMPGCGREVVTKLIISHAYTECWHVAQCFVLPNFRKTQHDALIRGARTKTFVSAELLERRTRSGGPC